MMKRDTERVAAFMANWGLEADGVRDDLLHMLREVREEEEHTPASPSLGITFTRIEARAREMLKKLAPADQQATPAMISNVRRSLMDMVVEELRQAGMQDPNAKALGAMIAAAMSIKAKST